MVFFFGTILRFILLLRFPPAQKVTAISILVSGNACRVKFKMDYPNSWWELGAQHLVQNNRNRYILWCEWWFQGRRAFTALLSEECSIFWVEIRDFMSQIANFVNRLLIRVRGLLTTRAKWLLQQKTLVRIPFEQSSFAGIQNDSLICSFVTGWFQIWNLCAKIQANNFHDQICKWFQWATTS